MEIRLSREEVDELLADVREDEDMFKANREFRRKLREKLEAVMEQNPRAIAFMLAPEVLHRGMVKNAQPAG